jgi:gas vesicle protein
MTGRRTFGAVLAASVALLAAGCGDSPEDTAHDNGKDVGQALRALADANSADEVQSAAAKLKDAVGQVRDDTGDRVRSQVQVQSDQIGQAIDDVKAAATAPDPATAATARTELQSDLQSLRSQAGSLSDSSDSVANSFWDGVQQGYDD